MTGVEISTVKSTVKSHDSRVLSTPKNQQNPNLETFHIKKIGKNRQNRETVSKAPSNANHYFPYFLISDKKKSFELYLH